MPRNFIIIYSSREGSSAIISTLSKHPDINIPLFKELDAFWIRKFDIDLSIHNELDRKQINTLRTNQT